MHFDCFRSRSKVPRANLRRQDASVKPLSAHWRRPCPLPVRFTPGRLAVPRPRPCARNAQKLPVVMHNPSGIRRCRRCEPSHHSALLEVLDCPIGLSCHSRGNTMVHAAIAIGASVIEKPLSRDNTMEDDEHIFSVNLADLPAFVGEIRDLGSAMQLDRDKILGRTVDPAARMMFRQSLIAKRPLAAGSEITSDDLTFARPGFGFPPNELDRIIGRRLTKDVAVGAVITTEDLV